jgi:PTH1 family peptidyl-tRNA hydrolase
MDYEDTPGRMDPAAYVLQDFKGPDAEIMDTTLNKAVEAIEIFIKHGLNKAMNMFNGSAEKDEG